MLNTINIVVIILVVLIPVTFHLWFEILNIDKTALFIPKIKEGFQKALSRQLFVTSLL